MEETHINGFAEDVSLDRLHYGGARLECVGARLDVNLCIQGNKLKSIVVPRSSGGRARSSINGAAGAELKRAVLHLSPRRDTFGKAGRGDGDIPYQPMKLIFRGVIAVSYTHLTLPTKRIV